MGKRQDNLWLRVKAAENKVSVGLKYVQFVGGRAVNSEDELCAAMVRWWNLVFPERTQDLIHIPNEGSGSRKRGADLKKIGVRSGVPDYLVCRNGLPIGWLEVKFGRNKLRPEQLKFKNTCIENRVLWAEIRSFEQFKQTLQKWGLYDPEKDKPKFFGAQQSQPQLDINKIFKRWRDEQF